MAFSPKNIAKLMAETCACKEKEFFCGFEASFLIYVKKKHPFTAFCYKKVSSCQGKQGGTRLFESNPPIFEDFHWP